MPLPRGGMVLDLTSEPSWCAVLEMAECSSPTRESIEVSLLNVGEDVIEYVVPSFPVFCVNLRRIKYTRPTTDTTVYDGFIRDDVCLMGKKYPTLVVIENGYENSFFVEANEVQQSVCINSHVLFNNQVYVIWKWFWGDEVYEDTPNTPFAIDQGEEESSFTSSESIHEDEGEESETTLSHAVVFKCVGVNKGSNAHNVQRVLEEIAEKLRKEEAVTVRVNSEPDNPFDCNAVAFQTPVNGKWMNIGYVVREAAPHVAHAIANNLIVSCEFSWVRYIVHWSKSGQGWYTGITITKRGTWPTEVVRSASTI